MARKRKFIEDPVPRENLPPLDVALEAKLIREKIDDVLKSLYSLVWKRRVSEDDHEYQKEDMRQIVLLFLAQEYELYRKGLINKFPPHPGYIYVTCKWKYLQSFKPNDDALGRYGNESYSEMLIYDRDSFSRSVPYHGRESAKYRDSMLNNLIDADKPEIPDMIDWWVIGLTIREIGVIFDRGYESVCLNIHAKYDAMEKSGARWERPRPLRRNRNR